MKRLTIIFLFFVLNSCLKGQTFIGAITPDTQVTQPDGFTYTPPFTIFETTSGSFFIPSTFDLSTYSGITILKSYYVDKSIGSDGNSGLSWDVPLAKISTALAKADVDQIYYKGYYYNNEKSVSSTRSVKIIGYDNNAWITGDVGNVIGAFTNVSNYYWSAIGSEYVGAVYDFSLLTALGKYRIYKAVASIALVDAEAGTFFTDVPNSKVYVRTLDDRAPDINLKLMYTNFYSEKDNVTYYFEGGNIAGGYFSNNTAAGGSKAYFKNCNLFHLTIAGIDAIIQDCNFVAQINGDVINIDAKNGVISNVIEIGLNPSDATPVGNNQASTAHNGCNVIRINGTYKTNSGQGIADVSNCKTWMMGCVSQNSTLAYVGYYCGGSSGKMWLDRCSSTGNVTDIETETGATVYLRDFITDGVHDGTGTVTTY